MLHNNVNIAGPSSKAEVVSAIRLASDATGVDFSYLLEEARAESSLNPQAQAATSSARGLYQFIESTWLEMVDRHGDKYGLDTEAAAITRDSKGRPLVRNEQAREDILRLREDPRTSALMAAELAKDNQQVLERKLGREVSSAELYMAHFLGAGGAAKFLHSLDNNPDVEADYIVPAAARANQAVFYKGGKALSLNQVYARFETRFEIEEPQLIPETPQFTPQQATLIAEAAEEVLQTSAPRAVPVMAAQTTPTIPATEVVTSTTAALASASPVVKPAPVPDSVLKPATTASPSPTTINASNIAAVPRTTTTPLEYSADQQLYELAMSELAAVRSAMQDSLEHARKPVSMQSLLAMQMTDISGRQRLNQTSRLPANLSADLPADQYAFTNPINAHTMMALSLLKSLSTQRDQDDDGNEWIV